MNNFLYFPVLRTYQKTNYITGVIVLCRQFHTPPELYDDLTVEAFEKLIQEAIKIPNIGF